MNTASLYPDQYLEGFINSGLSHANRELSICFSYWGVIYCLYL